MNAASSARRVRGKPPALKDGLKERAQIRKLRPWFLVLAMLTVWIVGVLGVTSGCGMVMYLHEGAMPDGESALVSAKESPNAVQALHEYAVVVQMRAIAECKQVTLPVYIARVLLSTTLVAASAMVLAGRRNALSFGLQALGVNVLFAVVAYALTTDVRAIWIDAVVAASKELDLPAEEGQFYRSRAFWYWFSRGELIVFQVGLLLAAAFALSLPKSRLYLQAMAEHERESNED